MASVAVTAFPPTLITDAGRASACPVRVQAARLGSAAAMRSYPASVYRQFCQRRARVAIPQQRGSPARRPVATASFAGTRELPIFPLSMVALPAATVYLNIFEARYRVLFNTLLYGESGLEDGLVNTESPFAGTREFGMCYVDQNGGMAGVGTLLRIEKFQKEEGGQMQVVCKGLQKFRINNINQERPVLICDVDFVEREDDSDSYLKELRNEVVELCRSTLDLSYRMGKINATESQLKLPEFDSLGPEDLSYWFAYSFLQDNHSKQVLLEMSSVRDRLEQERDMMKNNLSYLSAAAAVESAFKDEST
mmetsp:Transcript_5421/g.15080  ORF Transcript_5421/g.15080 Transcript_5421/m.15080 type:complete len:308 (-) Transcript_5421:293-1216(-)|eukprot:CAMPEP_0117663754 /NCGR_PEP_ID=MMETSP0804-20121206/8794_1 /TAXON_ID=1074897 /ORGANISM="Tetraselmis astigmatica, Strain CCMP880" /LENGTH=307 /DNA_ID=CAMNT_0005470819 /DNA_START=90 /DNA_END=1013 /DNA_ORIENTATION=+